MYICAYIFTGARIVPLMCPLWTTKEDVSAGNAGRVSGIATKKKNKSPSPDQCSKTAHYLDHCSTVNEWGELPEIKLPLQTSILLLKEVKHSKWKKKVYLFWQVNSISNVLNE